MPTRFPAITELSLGQVSDADLLRRFAQEGDQAAFELLVWRHRRLVFGVCRRVVGHSHDAEDAAQAAFLILARRADAIRGTNVAGWLARVAYRCAARVRASRRAGQPSDLSAVPAPEQPATDPDLSVLLDAELDRLPEKYRLPVVLCYLHGRTYDQAATELNCPVGTLCGWLTRAKAMLRRRLVRRGVTLSTGGLTAYLSGLGSQASADDPIRSITTAALAYANGEAIPEPAAAIANGVVHMMSWQSKLLPAVLGSVALLLGLTAAVIGLDWPKAPVPNLPIQAKKTDTDLLQGVWVFDTARRGSNEMLDRVWTSKLTVTGTAITVERFFNRKVPLKGTILLDPTTEPKQCDLKLEEFELKLDNAAFANFPEIARAANIPAGTYAGIYDLVGDRLRVRFAGEPGGKRPTSFEETGNTILGATLVKAPATFKEFPNEITVRVLGADGKPVVGALVSRVMLWQERSVLTTPASPSNDRPSQKQEQQNQPSARATESEETGWVLDSPAKTGTDGMAKQTYNILGGSGGVAFIVRDLANKQMGTATISPASVLGGPVTVTLRPECKVIVTVTCDELKNAGQGGNDLFNADIRTASGLALACGARNKSGKFEYSLPPGEYAVHVSGNDLMGSRRVVVSVPPDQSEYAVPPIALAPTGLLALLGKAAPELTDVVAWKGRPVKFADLKGQYVLVEFWGYWCPPCVRNMSELMEVHEKFKDRGVAIVGVHIDVEGEIDSVNAFDEKLARARKELWKGKDIPFSVALSSGKRALAEKFGIQEYPSMILIDREGKVVGAFPARDAKEMTEQIEKLLHDEKK
jgi:RNA polymerase sigma factor (sigma-70 family)